jgi:hypothetical protein
VKHKERIKKELTKPKRLVIWAHLFLSLVVVVVVVVVSKVSKMNKKYQLVNIKSKGKKLTLRRPMSTSGRETRKEGKCC